MLKITHRSDLIERYNAKNTNHNNLYNTHDLLAVSQKDNLLIFYGIQKRFPFNFNFNIYLEGNFQSFLKCLSG